MRNVWNDYLHRFLSLAKTYIILFAYYLFFSKKFKKKIGNNGLFVSKKDGPRLKVDTRNVDKLCLDC